MSTDTTRRAARSTGTRVSKVEASKVTRGGLRRSLNDGLRSISPGAPVIRTCQSAGSAAIMRRYRAAGLCLKGTAEKG